VQAAQITNSRNCNLLYQVQKILKYRHISKTNGNKTISNQNPLQLSALLHTHTGKGEAVTVPNYAPRHEDVLGVEVYRHSFLTSALEGCEWSVTRPGRFIPRERTPGTPWIGGYVGPRAGLDAVEKRKIHSPHRESNPRTPIIQPVASRSGKINNFLHFCSTWNLNSQYAVLDYTKIKTSTIETRCCYIHVRRIV
jgi:hypothetical protein